jgi:hypothetical protein
MKVKDKKYKNHLKKTLQQNVERKHTKKSKRKQEEWNKMYDRILK